MTLTKGANERGSLITTTAATAGKGDVKKMKTWKEEFNEELQKIHRENQSTTIISIIAVVIALLGAIIRIFT